VRGVIFGLARFPGRRGEFDSGEDKGNGSNPQVAAVGLTLQAARDHGADARAYDVPSSGTAGAAFYGTGTPGTARIVVDEHRG
jgi:Pyridine nucleotide-disulphide oxidoreductase, dimerisation domain